MNDVLSILEELENESGRNAKIDILNHHKNNIDLREVVQLALDPFVQFYIRKIPPYTPEKGKRQSLDSALNNLVVIIAGRKSTGDAAKQFVVYLLESLSARDAKVLERVIKKDLRCGVSDSTVNKVWKSLVPTYPCMLASAFDQKLVDKMSWPAIVQTKMDGMRFNAIVRKNGTVEFRSRNGKEIQIADPGFGMLFAQLTPENMRDVVFDGELICADLETGKWLDRKTSNGICNKAVKGTQSLQEGMQVCAVLWDMIPLSDFQKGVCKTPYSARLTSLKTLFPAESDKRIHTVCTNTVDNLREVEEVFREALEAGEEGIILKAINMPWEDKRSKKQIKFKDVKECDLRVVEWQEGTGKNVGRLGALVCESSDGKIRVGVGTGFNDADRDAITPDVVGSIVAVKYNARITDRKKDTDSLFLPVFVEIRTDKDTADSSEVI